MQGLKAGKSAHFWSAPFIPIGGQAKWERCLGEGERARCCEKAPLRPDRPGVSPKPQHLLPTSTQPPRLLLQTNGSRNVEPVRSRSTYRRRATNVPEYQQFRQRSETAGDGHGDTTNS